MIFTVLLLTENLALFPTLPWWQIIVGTVVAYLFGFLWYGVLLKKPYMELIQNQEEKTNHLAMLMQLFGTFVLAYLIGVFSLFEAMFLLGIDALMGVVLFLSLAGALFQRGNNRYAIRFWLITAGYELIAILIITIVMLLFT